MRIHNLFQFARESLTQIETSVQQSQLCTCLGPGGFNVTQLAGFDGCTLVFFVRSFLILIHRFCYVASDDLIVQSILFNDVIAVTCLHFTSAILFAAFIKTNEETVSNAIENLPIFFRNRISTFFKHVHFFWWIGRCFSACFNFLRLDKQKNAVRLKSRTR